MRSNGFTLIELMIVVVIVGVLTAIAIPSYLTYMAKAQIAYGINQLDKCAGEFEAYYQAHQSFPASVCGISRGTYVTTNVQYTYLMHYNNTDASGTLGNLSNGAWFFISFPTLPGIGAPQANSTQGWALGMVVMINSDGSSTRFCGYQTGGGAFYAVPQKYLPAAGCNTDISNAIGYPQW